MGGCCESSKAADRKGELDSIESIELIVATLNYSGILNSPFEFYVPTFQQELN